MFKKELNEECGIFGAWNVPDASEVTYYGLHALQHRGQEGAGIVSVDETGHLTRIKGLGLVTEVFNQRNLSQLKGSMAIGHVRYTTSGGQGIENVQPFLFRHNSPTEREKPRIIPILQALNMIEGAFAFVIMTKNRIYAMRDKYGLRPLSIGRLGDGYVVASETCAFSVTGAEFIRDIEPGEVVTIDNHGIRSQFYSEYQRHAMCAMEYIYFARPDSDIEGCNVHSFRKESGKILWREQPADADIVVGVPDSSLSAASGYAEASGLPNEMGLIKNKYIARTFIQPSQKLRERGVKMKLSPVKSIVNGKRIVLVDDSIVRGTTSLRIVRMLREAGAREVHVRIASPMMKNPCYYGIDMSTKEEILCSSRTLEQARQVIEADSLGYLSFEGLLEAGRRSDLCMACFDGKYPTALYSSYEEYRNEDKF